MIRTITLLSPSPAAHFFEQCFGIGRRLQHRLGGARRPSRQRSHRLGADRDPLAACARMPSLRAQGEARHLPAHVRRRRRTLDLFDYKPELDEVRRAATARQPAQGRTLRLHQGRCRSCSDPPFKFKQHGESGVWFSRSAAAPGDARRRRGLHQVDAHRRSSTTRPAQICSTPARPQIPAGRAFGLVGHRTGSAARADDLPAFVVLISGSANPSGGARATVEQRVPAEVYQGVQFQRQGDPILYRVQPRRHRPRRRGARASTRSRKLNRDAAREMRRPGDRDAHQRSTSWPSACRRACPS